MTTINRATWVDDDGSGATGTIINNARLQGDVYDKVDQALATLDAKDAAQDSSISANGPHKILSANHTDSVPATLLMGDLLRADATGKLARLAADVNGSLLGMISGLPGWNPNPAILSGTRPVLQFAYTGDAALARAFRPVANQFVLSHNLAYDGTTWTLDDTARAGIALQLAIGGGDLNIYYTPAGANPRTPTLIMSFTGATNLLQVPTGTVSAGAGFLERGRTVPLGEWTSYQLTAATLTAATGTFTLPGGQAGFGFTTASVGKIGFVNLALGPFTTSAATAWVRISLPAGFVPLAANANQLGTNYTAALALNVINISTASGLTFFPNVAQTGTFPAGAGLYLNGAIFFALA